MRRNVSWYVKCVYNRAGYVGRLKKVLAAILRPRMQEFESNEPCSNPDSSVSLSASVLGLSEVTPGQVCGRWHFLCSLHFAFCNASGISLSHLSILGVSGGPLTMALGRSHLPSDNLANGMTAVWPEQGGRGSPEPRIVFHRDWSP